jgi:phosphatidylglycerophosphatase A
MNTSNGRKIDENRENPVDNVMLYIAEIISPYLHKLNYTPNGITTISTILNGAALYHLYKREILPFAIYFIIAYLFDNVDGYYARKYKMTSVIGDYYDHIKDFVVGAVVAYILYTQYNITSHPVALVVLLVMLVFTLIYIGCQESSRDTNDKSDSLSVIDKITPSKKQCDNNIGIFRWFGPGTLILVLVGVVYYLYESENKYIDLSGLAQQTTTMPDINIQIQTTPKQRFYRLDDFEAKPIDSKSIFNY